MNTKTKMFPLTFLDNLVITIMGAISLLRHSVGTNAISYWKIKFYRFCWVNYKRYAPYPIKAISKQFVFNDWSNFIFSKGRRWPGRKQQPIHSRRTWARIVCTSQRRRNCSQSLNGDDGRLYQYHELQYPGN